MEAYQKLEEEWSKFCGFEHCVACSSGTAALHLALETLEVSKRDPVIVPDFTMVACARAVKLAGAECEFVDCRDDLNIDPREIWEKLKWKKHPIMAVHTYGRRCDMNEISRMKEERGVLIIEDLAEAHGIAPGWNTDAACWSFYKNKIIAGEEGGMVAFRDSDLAKRARSLRSLGFTDEHNFRHIPRGHNYRLSNCHAELILESLHRYDENNERRRVVEAMYDSLIPKSWQMSKRDAVWVYDFVMEGITWGQRHSIISDLRAQGVQARHAFYPMTGQEEFLSPQIRSPMAWKAAREIMYLPVSPSMTLEEVRVIWRKLRESCIANGYTLGLKCVAGLTPA